jgi:hypothetical protein
MNLNDIGMQRNVMTKDKFEARIATHDKLHVKLVPRRLPVISSARIANVKTGEPVVFLKFTHTVIDMFRLVRPS